MPVPLSDLSSDKYIYHLTNIISPYLCSISPNLISWLGFFTIIPILNNLEYGRGLVELILLTFCKQFLDCLDGTVARTCGKVSRFGSKLDTFLDMLFIFIIGIYVGKRLIYDSTCNLYLKGILLSIIVLSIYHIAYFLFKKLKAEKNGDDLESIELGNIEFFHDNSVILVVILFIVIKYAC